MSTVRLHALIVEDHSTSALSLKAALSVMGFATFGFASILRSFGVSGWE